MFFDAAGVCVCVFSWVSLRARKDSTTESSHAACS